MIKNVIFDWSGTLSDDITPVYIATMGVFRELGLSSLTFEEFKREFTLPYMKFYRKFKKDADKEEIERLFYQEIVLAGNPEPFPKAREVLEFLKKEDIRIALLSSHIQKKLIEEIRDYGFQRFFVEVNGGVHDKVEAILEILGKNCFRPNETLYVGDMAHDIEAGKKAGAITVAVSWGYQPKEKLLKEHPDFLIENLADLERIILKLNGRRSAKSKNKQTG